MTIFLIRGCFLLLPFFSLFSEKFLLSLKEAEELTLKSNPAIQLTRYTVQQYDYQYSQSVSSWFPEITFGSMYAKLQKSQKISPQQRQTHLFSNQVELTQPIFSSTLLGNLNLSKLAKTEARAVKGQVTNQILLQIRNLYLKNLIREESLLTQKQAIAYFDASYKSIREKYLAGNTTSLAENQAKTVFSQAITSYYNTIKEAGEAKRQLVFMLNLDSIESKNLVLKKEISLNDYPFLHEKLNLLQNLLATQPIDLDHLFTLFSPEEEELWTAQAKQLHPELKRARLYLQETNEKSRISKAGYLPQISAFVDYGYYQPINGQFFKQRNDFAGGVQLSWCLFNSFKREMKIKEASSLKEAASIAYQYKNDEIAITIRNDLHQIEEALFTYLTSLDHVKLTEQKLQEATVSLSSGTIEPLELQQASYLFSEAQFQVKQNEYRILEAYFQLKHDAGTDLILEE